MSVATDTYSQDFTLERLQGLWEIDGRVTWRHDVDYDIRAAVMMAQAEHEAKIQSTYYIRLRAEEYNPFNRNTLAAIEMIAAFGHTIGLHLDTWLKRDARVNLFNIAADCEHDYKMLRAEVIDLKRKVSYHAPPHELRWHALPGFVCADSPEWRNHYISDGRGVIRDDIEQAIRMGRVLQINLHPEWWFMPEPARSILHARETIAP